ncbi:hypothetical protein CFOL_v3_12670 [Cephalotus follicularis]|uniref:Uncharacterized protein n=1 Tax=Cephalotus follicularis TaxID=3775 RepID=A0A1Q3BMR8_CEPFO|nr:hypothetical protein CFOL_v3_12670 [Cephalotus follicularis]
MANTLTSSLSTPIRASSPSSRKRDPNRKKPVSFTWWAPLFGVSTDPDYITSDHSSTKKSDISDPDTDPSQPRSRFTLGCFTEEKAKQLRLKTVESYAFHDIMYHSAIASRLASDMSGRPEK